MEGRGRDYEDVREIFGVNCTESRRRFSKFVLHLYRNISGEFLTTLDAL